MKQVFSDGIYNVDGTDIFDATFLFQYMLLNVGNKEFFRVEGIEEVVEGYNNGEVITFFLEHILVRRKNKEILEKIVKYPAMWSEVYSSKEEMKIFSRLFDFAIQENKKIHIIGITLGTEVEILEKYYFEMGFFDKENNTFKPDFSLPLVTVSVKIENIMWRGSDYKRLGKKLFLCPPIREAGEVKNLFKGINRGVIAGVYFPHMTEEIFRFFENQINEEILLSLTLAKILRYNFEAIGMTGEVGSFQVTF